MSTVSTGKRVTTPKKQRTRSQTQQKSRNQEDVCVRTSLPPLVEGPVYAILTCHIPKLRWNAKHQSFCRFVNIKIAWWGEDDTSAVFKPQISGTSPSPSHQPSTTAKYYIRSELKQFAKYLTDASELVLRILDSESNRLIGTAKVQNLSTLSITNSIKGYQSIFTNKGDKLGEVFVSIRLLLPGTHDSNENLAAMSGTSDVSNPPSRRNSFGANDFNQDDHFDNGLRTYKLDRPFNADHLNSVHSSDSVTKQQRFDSTVPFKTYTVDSRTTQPGVQAYKEQPTGKVVEALIERANRLREDMIKSSLQKPTITERDSHPMNSALYNSNNNAEVLTTQHCDDIDPLHDNENLCDILGIKSTGDLNNSNDSILTDLDGLENEQSLLDDLLYGGEATSATGANNNNHKNTTISKKKSHPRGKPPTGRSPSPSMTRAGGVTNRSRSTRSRSLAQSSDSDTASRVSFDMPSSDLDDSGNESHDDDNLSAERIQLLSYVRTARVRLEQLRLNVLNNGRESPSYFDRSIYLNIKL